MIKVARSTPSEIASIAFLKSISIKLATSAPVQPPVPGSGIPTNSRRPQNSPRFKLASEGKFLLEKSEQWGTYLAFFPIGGAVNIHALSGVRYPLRDFCLCDNTAPTLTVSNEIMAERAELELSGDPVSGLLIMETCDREESKWIMP